MNFKQTFLEDVKTGLSSNPKSLPSKYFYDKRGDELFQQIMALEEYYLTRAEYEIFQLQKQKILDVFYKNQDEFRLVEFGAGDGYKTKVLLEHFIEKKIAFEYKPIDISQNALDKLIVDLNGNIPKLQLSAEQGDYFQVLSKLPRLNHKRNIILFLGSNIGNFTLDEIEGFLKGIRAKVYKDDLLFLGIDLKKDPDKILKAYDDEKGVTKAFNLNLLARVNAELGGDFDLNGFDHCPSYNPVNGECISTLVSNKNQTVTISGASFVLNKWESIQTEISRKFSLEQIADLATKCGFEIEENLLDSNAYFVDSIWKAV
ncbi:MAG: L-histidine N(alpha)-methyltransferase [Cyclobacteriaceae bacterium]